MSMFGRMTVARARQIRLASECRELEMAEFAGKDDEAQWRAERVKYLLSLDARK